MNIKTKFNVGQTVFYIKDGQAVEQEVRKAEVRIEREVNIFYAFNYSPESKDWFHENKVFASMSALKASLKPVKRT